MRNLEYVYQGMFSPPEVHENGRCIAVVTSSDKDAKLFAAAPELLLVCKQVLEYVVSFNSEESDPEFQIARALTRIIAKVEGDIK